MKIASSLIREVEIKLLLFMPVAIWFAGAVMCTNGSMPFFVFSF